jgi:DNA-binding GntR family transcriptional regulator
MMSPKNSSIDETAKWLVYKKLRRSIILGHCQAGSRFDVASMAKEYNISITPVRDALHMLCNEGLVEIKSRSGYFVAQITLKQLKDLLDLRRIIEVECIERAALRVTEAQIAELRSVHAGYTGDDDESYDRYTEENRRFHMLIARASGNYELAELVGKLHDKLARFMVLRRAGRTQEITHQLIVDSLEKHDVVKARQALIDDIGDAHETILDILIRRDSDKWQL